jgi:hypothetical protein
MLLILCSLASHAYAESRTFGDWVVSPSGGIYEAFTANDSGSTFGVICGADDCKFYLRLGISSCDKDASYKTLINSDSGASVFNLSCSPLTIEGRKEYVLLIEESLKSLSDPLLKTTTIGFAIPMAGGQFKVSRFSMRGFPKAMELIGNLRTKDESEKKSQGSQGIRDTNL